MRSAVRGVQGDLIIALRILAVCFLAPIPAVAAQAAPAKPIPIRQLTPVVSTDSGVIASTDAIRVLADGRVLHNDAIKHRLLLLDTTLKRYTIIADSAGQGAYKFGSGSGGLLPFAQGDSTAWIDAQSKALVVVDAGGHFGTVMAPLRAADMSYYAGEYWGVPGFDVRGRLYYRTALTGNAPRVDRFAPDAPDSIATQTDSVPIVRADIDRRRLDTVAKMRVPTIVRRVIRSGPNRGTQLLMNPLPVTDEWAYLPDGTVAILRGQDYHVDWYAPDGTHRSTPKMPFDWRRVTDEEKQRMVDSAKQVEDSLLYARTVAARKLSGVTVSRTRDVVRVNDIADYYPPIRAQQIRVDRDDNLWVVPATSVAATGGILYDAINRSGEIVERVQLPVGRRLEGFGPNGAIYMSVPSTTGWTRLERARVIRQ